MKRSVCSTWIFRVITTISVGGMAMKASSTRYVTVTKRQAWQPSAVPWKMHERESWEHRGIFYGSLHHSPYPVFAGCALCRCCNHVCVDARSSGRSVRQGEKTTG